MQQNQQYANQQYQNQQNAQQYPNQLRNQQYPNQFAPQPVASVSNVQGHVEIRSFDIWSMMKFQAVVMTLAGIIISAVYYIAQSILNTQFRVLSSSVGTDATASIPVSMIGTNPSILMLIGIIVFMAILGLISGAVIAIVYNVISKIIGGIKIELK
jgi:hypothetical protein